MIGFVYILKCNNGKYYIGSTKDIERRTKQHKDGKVVSTKNILPIELIRVKQYETIKEARQMEYKIKKQKSKKTIEQFIMDSFG